MNIVKLRQAILHSGNDAVDYLAFSIQLNHPSPGFVSQANGGIHEVNLANRHEIQANRRKSSIMSSFITKAPGT